MKIVLLPIISLLIFVFMASSVYAQSITGTVRNASNSPIENATVEAWQGDTMITNDTTDTQGDYNLSGLTNGIEYLIRAYQFYNITTITDPNQCQAAEYRGYIPKNQSVTAPNTNIDFNLSIIPRKNIDYFTTSGYRTVFYGFLATFNNQLIRRGDVITAKDPDNVLSGMAINCWNPSLNKRGWYYVQVWGDDVDTGQDEGAVDGDLIDFFINEFNAINVSGPREWDRGSHNTELSNTGSLAECQLLSAYWNQSSAYIDYPVELWTSSTACANKEVNFTIIEGGSVSRGYAQAQPGTTTIDFTETAHVTWMAECVNDSGGGDANPPEYYFITELIENTSIKINSSDYNEFLETFPDTSPPNISNDNISFFGENVFITWETDKPATSQIDYGKTLSYGQSVTNNTLTYNHVIFLNGLDLDTLYYYRIVSTDKYNNTNSSVSSSFTISTPVTIVLQQGAYNYYFGVEDTYLYSQGDRDVGGLSDIRLGQRLDNGDYSHPILKFNTSPIPSNVNILSAKLDLYLFARTEGDSEIIGNLYRVLRYWGPAGNGSGEISDVGEVSWNYSEYNITLWGIPGADQVGVDREGIAQDTLTFNAATPFGWKTWNLDEDMVQAWVSNSSSNYGVVIKSPVISNATRYRFTSSEGIIDNRSKLTITYAKGLALPTINQIQCQIDSVWDTSGDFSCLIDYGQNLTAVRTNCTSDNNTISDVTFKFENIQDSNVFFENTTTNNVGDYWILDNDDVLIQDSGDFRLTATCVDNESLQKSDFVSSFVPWGVLNVNLIEPTNNINVNQNEFFNFNTSVGCANRECGNVNTTLNTIGGIIPMNSGTPFYTINNNPQTCPNLQAGNTCITAWQVNATAENGTYEVFVTYDPVQYSGVNGNETMHVNVTITSITGQCEITNAYWSIP